MRVLRITGSTTIGASATTLTWGRDNGASYLDLDPHRVRQVVLRLAVATANLTSLKIYAKAHASDSKWIPLATAAADYTGGANIYVKDSRVYNDGDDSYVDAAAYTTNADDYAVLVLVNPGYVQLKITAEGSGAVVSAYAAGFDSDVDLSTPHLTIHATVNNDVGLLDTTETEINPAKEDGNLASILTSVQLIDDAVAAEDAALGKGILLQGDDGTDRHNVAVNTSGHVLVALQSFSPGAGATDLGKAEDAAHTSGDVGVMSLTVRTDEVAALAGATGDYQPLITDASGQLYVVEASGVSIASDATTIATATSNIDTNTGTLAGTVDGSEVQVDVAGALPAGNNNIGNVDIVTGPTGASALAVQGTVAAGSGAANNPVLLGAHGVSEVPAAVDTGDVAKVTSDLHGRIINAPYAPPEDYFRYSTGLAELTDTTEMEVVAKAAGLRAYVTHFSAINAHANTDTAVVLEDEDNNALAVIWCEAAGGGASLTFDPPLRVATVNKDVDVHCETTGTATYVNVSGFLAP